MSEGGEKNLPPSAKKLQDARKRGQLAKSRDIVAIASFAAATGVLLGNGRSSGNALSTMLVETLRHSEKPFAQRSAELAGEWLFVALLIVGPVVGAAIAATILANIVVSRGFVFTLHPMSEGLQKLNPITNLKQIFGMHALTELLKSVLKVVALGVMFVIVIRGALNAILLSAYCGASCQILLINHMAVLILTIGGLALLVLGIGDMLIQNWMFMRDMRMSVDEAKREHKEQDGSPEIKSEQRRIRHETLEGPAVGAKHATMFVIGGGNVIGVRFVQGETPVPTIVYKGDKVRGTPVVISAAERGVKIFPDKELAILLAKAGKMGQFIPRESFGKVAMLIHKASSG